MLPAIAIVVLLIALAATLSVWRLLTKGVDELTEVARRLSQGDYRARVRDLPEHEYGKLGETINALADRIEATVSELSSDKAQLSAILANIVEAVVAVDGEGRIIALNPALCALFSINPREALDRPFVATLRHARLNELLSHVLKDGVSRVEEVALVTPEERVFESHAVPLIQDRVRAGALLVLHDITRMRALEKVRREFVANVSHELRTPLASIRGFAETLRDGAINDVENRMEFIETIEKDAQRLSALVEDLLDLSAIESGHRKPVLEALSLLELASEAAASLKVLADRNRVKLIIKENPTLPKVRADRPQLKQVLANLMDNAVKFNRDEGSVTVSATVEGGHLVVSVEDTGQGIPEADLPRVFERFYRVDKARARELGGTGLGLSIAKHIVEAHGGAIEVKSRLGEGSIFRFKLPL